MDDWRKISGGYYSHPDMPEYVFPQKPAEWITHFLLSIYRGQYDRGYHHHKMNVRHFMEGILHDD